MSLSYKNMPKFLSGSSLKIIALISMFIDHIGAGILIFYLRSIDPETVQQFESHTAYTQYINDLTRLYDIIRGIGRLAFPIFCFLLVQGFCHTHDRKKYALRLSAFCLISELPFDLAFFHNPFYIYKQNVFFTLLIGLLVIWGISTVQLKFQHSQWTCMLLEFACLCCGCTAAYILRTDYSYIGVLTITLIYLFRHSSFSGSLLACMLLFVTNEAELPALVVPFILLFYNGKRGLPLKYFFYAFYPVHLLIIYALCMFVN